MGKDRRQDSSWILAPRTPICPHDAGWTSALCPAGHQHIQGQDGRLGDRCPGWPSSRQDACPWNDHGRGMCVCVHVCTCVYMCVYMCGCRWRFDLPQYRAVRQFLSNGPRSLPQCRPHLKAFQTSASPNSRCVDAAPPATVHPNSLKSAKFPGRHCVGCSPMSQACHAGLTAITFPGLLT